MKNGYQVDMPTATVLRTLFLHKLKSFKTLSVLANDALVSSKVSAIELRCAMHWALLSHKGERLDYVRPMSALSVVLMAEVEEVVRQAAIGGPKGVGILDAKRLGELVVGEGQVLVERLVCLRTNCERSREFCRWAEHQWMLSELAA